VKDFGFSFVDLKSVGSTLVFKVAHYCITGLGKSLGVFNEVFLKN